MKPLIVIASKTGQLGNRLVLLQHVVAFAAEHGFEVASPAFAEYAADFEGPSSGNFCPWPTPPAPSGKLGRIAAVHREARLVSTMEAALEVGQVLPLAGDFEAGLLKGWRETPRPWPENLVARYFGRKWKPRSRALDYAVIADGMEHDTDLRLEGRLETIRRHEVVFLRGWHYRHADLVPRHAQAIRSFLLPVAQRRRAADALFAGLRARHDHVVGVHIRHGDYREWQGGRCYFETAEYAALMAREYERLRRAHASPCFLVCSNEPQPAEAFGGLPVHFGPGQLAEDMYALGLCDTILGPPSTFSYWASFQGKKPLSHLHRDEATHGIRMTEPQGPLW